MSKKVVKNEDIKAKENKSKKEKVKNSKETNKKETQKIKEETQNIKEETQKLKKETQKIKEETQKIKKETKQIEKEKINEKDTNNIIKIITYVILVISIIELIYASYLLYEKYRAKFKNLEVEIGTTTSLEMKDFLKDKKYEENSILITNLEGIDYSKTGEYKVLLSHNGREEEVVLKLIDTTPPTVEFQDITRYIDYIPNADDFIVKKEDLSEMQTSITDVPTIDKFQDYNVNVIVKDASGNETSKICKLSIKWIRDEFTMEKGHILTKEDLLYGVEQDRDLLDDKRLEEISNSEIGEYEIKTNKDGIEKTTIIKVTDLTPPTLELRNITIYDDEKVGGKESFIANCYDASGEVTTTMKTDINYSKLGTQEIIIEAVDKYGNKVEKTAILTIRKDTVGPVFSGLSTMSVAKNGTINYTSGVSARDAKYGICEYQVDSSSVNTSVAGTYYATYTSKDPLGNKTSTKRKIVVNHDQADVDALVSRIAASISSDVESIRDYCRNNIRYGSSYGDGDPIWYGFNNWTGNCYVHALCFQALLRAKGYETQLIWVTNKTHYWNLVKLNGVWRHMDSTPDRNHRKISIMTDEQRLSTLSGRDWDHSAWPAAN